MNSGNKIFKRYLEQVHTKSDIADNKICYIKWDQNYHHK